MSRKSGRRTRAETAELVRQSAVDLLRDHGLRGFANSVRLNEALATLEHDQGIRLTHGSVYGRIWDDQRHFQLDVVATTLSGYHGDEIAAAVAGAPDPVAAFGAAVEVAKGSRQWNLWLGAHTASVSTPEQDDDAQLADALQTARSQVEASVEQALRTLPAPAVHRIVQLTVHRIVQPIDWSLRANAFVTALIGASLGSASPETVALLASMVTGLGESTDSAGRG